MRNSSYWRGQLVAVFVHYAGITHDLVERFMDPGEEIYGTAASRSGPSASADINAVWANLVSADFNEPTNEDDFWRGYHEKRNTYGDRLE